MPDIKPIPGEATQRALPQAEMVVPAPDEEPGLQSEDARGGGRCVTHEYAEDETRPQDMHSSVVYQEETADPGEKPRFVAYTDLTLTKGTVRG